MHAFPRLACLVLVCAATSSLNTRAFADPSPTDIAIAKKLFSQASEDESGERWSDALTKLKRVATIKETPGILFHIALCEEKLGSLMDSRASYDRAARLAEKGTSADEKQIVTDAAAAIVRLDARLPTIIVNASGSANATITVDGAPFDSARLGRPFHRDPGELRVEAHAVGKKTFETRRVLIDRDNVVIDIVFLQDDVVPEPAASTQAPALSASSAPTSSPSAPEVSKSIPLAAWITGGAAVAAAGVGVYWMLHRSSLQSSTDTTCANPDIVCDRQARDARARTYLIGAVAAGGTALVLGGVTAYLAIRTDGKTTSAGIPLGEVAVGGTF